MITRAGTSADIDGILQLQDHNLYTNLSEQERLNGFVTTPFTVKQLELLLKEDGVFVAVNNGVVAGYVLAGSWRYYSIWPIFDYMVARFPIRGPYHTPIRTDNSFQYGPICIADNYRGSNLLPDLFECMRIAFSNRFPIGYTFINRINQRSYIAHTQKLGLQVTDEFEFDGRFYYGLAFDTNATVMKATSISTGLAPIIV